ncbi:MAG TPA: redoxin domain-containing protein [Verrucomicrobiae bacterium]|nr:redoxin domain-containing protein [Verrucomicrobiae bacterium]
MLMNLIHRTARLMVLGGGLVLVGGCATEQPPTAAALRLAAPQSDSERAYLGLPAENSSFKLEDIQSEVLVVDCFDMYCHYCQLGAGHVNELYRLVQKRGWSDRVKFIGLGVGDTPFEVATYRDKFQVPFPLFPDRKTTVTKSLGPLRLPNLIVLHKQDVRWQVIYSSSGELLDPEEFLTHLQITAPATPPPESTAPDPPAPLTCKEGSNACRVTGTPGPLIGDPVRCPALHLNPVSHD